MSSLKRSGSGVPRLGSTPKVGRVAPNAPWPVVRLGDFTTKIGSGATPRGGESVYKETGVPFIRSMNVHFGGFKHDGLAHIDSGEAGRLANVAVEADDVLLNITGASIGRVTTAPSELAGARVNQHVCIIRPKAEISGRFLAYFFASPEEQARVMNVQVGATRQALTKFVIENWKVPVPPLPEQRRIVAEIEKQFTRLDAGVTALKRVQANLKRYRAAVLKAACEGRLVPTESARLKAEGRMMKAEDSGAGLLARILTERRKNWQGRGLYKEAATPVIADFSALPEGWAWASVAQVGESTTGFTPPKGDSALFGGGIPFFKPTDLDAGYHVREYRDSLSVAGAEHGRLLPERTILVTCIGATIGKVGLARVQCATNQQINALTVPTALLLPEYVYGFFASPFGQSQIKGNASATTLPILNKSKFEALALPLPPLAEQTRIVAEVERRLSVVDELEAVVTANLQRAVRLRQAILQKAFAGRPC